MVDNAIKPALRTALRLHEIGNDTPYRISFAAKGKSGGSFGFMQGDLAAGQSDVTRTFREAMAAAGMDSGKIDRLVALLSRHQIKNPLSPSETAEVDQALRASSGLVDRMDERILQEVYRDLDICLAHASRKNRTVAAKAQLYMALWINMSGPPTKLLTWLDGGDPGLPRRVPAAGATIDGDDMEEYLAGTNYYVAHPRNMQHLRECAAAGMRELGTALLASAMPTDSDGGANALLYAAAPAAAAPSSVTVAVKSSDGESHQVSIQKTGRDTGAISRRDSAGSSQVYNVTAIKARTDGTRLTCNGPYPSKIVCTLSAGRNGVADAIEITVSNTWFYDGTTSYTPAHADFEKLRSFIAQSGFPALAAEAPAASVGVFAATDTMGAPTLPATPAAQDGDQNTFDAAIAAVETWKLHPSSPAYDTHVAGPVRAAASRVTTDPNPRDLLKWLELQSSAMNIADADILRTTLALRDMLPDGFSHAVQGLPASQRLRVALALGDDGPGPPPGGGGGRAEGQPHPPPPPPPPPGRGNGTRVRSGGGRSAQPGADHPQERRRDRHRRRSAVPGHHRGGRAHPAAGGRSGVTGRDDRHAARVGAADRGNLQPHAGAGGHPERVDGAGERLGKRRPGTGAAKGITGLLAHPLDDGLVVLGRAGHAQAARRHGVEAFGDVLDQGVVALGQARGPGGVVAFLRRLGQLAVVAHAAGAVEHGFRVLGGLGGLDGAQGQQAESEQDGFHRGFLIVGVVIGSRWRLPGAILPGPTA